MTLSNFLNHCDEYVNVRIYSVENLDDPMNNYDRPESLLMTLEDEILNRKVAFFGIERAKPNKDDTIVMYVIIKNEDGRIYPYGKR